MEIEVPMIPDTLLTDPSSIGEAPNALIYIEKLHCHLIEKPVKNLSSNNNPPITILLTPERHQTFARARNPTIHKYYLKR